MARKVIPDALVATLAKAGLNDREIAEYLWEHHRIIVSRQTVAAARQRAGHQPRSQVRVTPWPLPAWAYRSEPARAIRWHERERLGMPLSPAEQRRLEKMRRYLAGLGDVVWHWDGDESDGEWRTVPRRPEVDTGLFRVPDADAERTAA